MNNKVLYERDMLYPTGNNYEPGCVHVQVYNPNKNARIPVLIDNKSNHSSVKHIDSIIRIMQSDIFDRIFIDMKKNVDIYIKSNTWIAEEYQDKKYVKITYNGDKYECTGTDTIE